MGKSWVWNLLRLPPPSRQGKTLLALPPPPLFLKGGNILCPSFSMAKTSSSCVKTTQEFSVALAQHGSNLPPPPPPLPLSVGVKRHLPLYRCVAPPPPPQGRIQLGGGGGGGPDPPPPPLEPQNFKKREKRCMDAPERVLVVNGYPDPPVSEILYPPCPSSLN